MAPGGPGITVSVPILSGGGLWRAAPPERFTEPEPAGEGLTVQCSLTSFARLLLQVREKRYARLDWHRLAVLGETLSLRRSLDALLCPAYLAEHWKSKDVVPFPHQLETARRVVTEMDGRAILADEVGLGKTLEAGIILKEYMLRGLAKKALILTPASLCWQWRMELQEKLDIPCAVMRKRWRDWSGVPIAIASMDFAKREPNRSEILQQNYDMLIVDEAHKLKSAATQNYQFVAAVRRTRCLFLTATPVQNDLKELYNLIFLLAPERAGSYERFMRRFAVDRRTPRSPEALRSFLSTVMIRNRRQQARLEGPERRVRLVKVRLGAEERNFYEALSAFARRAYEMAHSYALSFLPFVLLQREACSSALAAAQTLERMLQTAPQILQEELAALFEQAVALSGINSKCDKLVRLLSQDDEKAIVFTEYRASQRYIRYRLARAGISTLAFDGSLSAGRKEFARRLFRAQARVLVSTESGGEGLNFQFCSRVINYDLPWNPMRVEQRIGRVHRLGQTRPVEIVNLATEETIEEHIVYLLHEKIDLFRSVIGGLDDILTAFGAEEPIEAQIARILMEGRTPGEIRCGLDRIAERLRAAESAAKAAEESRGASV